MKIEFKKINREFVLLSIIFIMGFGLGLGSLFLYKDLKTKDADPVGYLLKVDLPIEGALISGNQTFRASVDGLDLYDYHIDWSVDGIRKGTMGVGKDFMTDMVFVDDWDWRRDGKYIIEFSAKKDGQEIAKTIKTVYKNEFLDNEDTSELKKEEQSIVSASLIKNKTAQVSNSFIDSNKADNFYSTNIAKNLSLNWVTAEKKDWVTQEFILNTDNFLDYRAFWQVENGHSNPINKKNDQGQNILAINFSGWWWKGSGPYLVTVYLEDFSGKRIASLDFSFTRANSNDVAIDGLQKISSISLVENTISQKQQPQKTQVKSTETVVTESTINSPVVDKISDTVVSKNKWRLSSLLPGSKPAIYSDLIQLQNSGPAYDAEAVSFIYNQSNSIWLNGNDYDFQLIKNAMDLAKEKKAMPVFVLYNIPQRDCSMYSAGGAANYSLYKNWIDKIASQINYDAVFILEPDALSMLNCLDQQGKNSRIDAIKYAVTKLTTIPNSYVYIDAGHPFWVNSKDMAERLKSVNVSLARGFALNVSNYTKLEDNISYGDYLSGLLGGKYYVVDSSRNGQGQHPKYEWCNPDGRGLGNVPTVYNNDSWLDAELWIKTPGESDGNCQGGPNAGSWWREYAVKLYTFRKK